LQTKAAISEKAAAAQELAQDTMKELFGGRSGVGAQEPGAQTASQQQQEHEREQKQEEAGTASQDAGPSSEGSAGKRAGVTDRVRQAAEAVISEMRAALSSEGPATSALRGAPKGGDIQMAQTTALAHHTVEEPAWQKQWRELRGKVFEWWSGAWAWDDARTPTQSVFHPIPAHTLIPHPPSPLLPAAAWFAPAVCPTVQSA
jgi:hypothetical protein